MNQAQAEAARHATRRDRYAGRRAWKHHHTRAVALLGRRDPAAVYAEVMAGHDAEVLATLGIGRLRTGRRAVS